MKKIKILPMILILCAIISCLSPCAFAMDDPVLNGKAAIVIDLDSGAVLYSLNQDDARAPASLTKVMTVLLALEAVDSGRCSLTDMVTAQDDCRNGMSDDSSTSGIVPGVNISIKDLLYCALLQSANEACNILGRYLAGSIDGFVEQMNQRADQLGCTNTHFMNTNGLPAENHYSTAHDLGLITMEAMKHPLFMEISNSTSYIPDCTAVNNGEPIGNSNALINITSIYSNGGKYLYDGAAGGKTGYTNAAGYCLVSTAKRNGINVLAVVLGCDGALNAGIEDYYNFIDSISLYDWVFDNFSYREILSSNEIVDQIEVELSESGAKAMLKPAADVTVLMPNEISDDMIERSVVVYNNKLRAPLAAGTVLGELQLSLNGKLYGTVKLVNSSTIELSRTEYIKSRLIDILSKGWVMTLIIIVFSIVLVYTILVLRYRRLRKKHLRERKLAEARRRAAREGAKAQPVRGYPKAYGAQRGNDRFEFGADVDDLFNSDNDR